MGGKSVSASFGITEWRAGESARAVCNRADKALYEAKQSGRNRVRVAEEARAAVAAAVA